MIKINDLTLKPPWVDLALVCYILGSGKGILSHDAVVVMLYIFQFLTGICCRDDIWRILDGVLKLLRFNGLTIERGRKELERFSLWYHVRRLKYWNWDLKSLSCSPVIVFSYFNVAISWESWKICIKAFKPDKRA